MCLSTLIMDPSSFSPLLDLAANDDVDAFKSAVDGDPSSIDAPAVWFCRQIGSTKMAPQRRTPLMVAAAYGSVDVLTLIIDRSPSTVHRCFDPHRLTALHCAAASGAPNAADVIKILLAAGADPDCQDSVGRRPADVIPRSTHNLLLHQLLGKELSLSISTSSSGSPPLSTSPSSDSTPSPTTAKSTERKEYPVDPSLPDIKTGIYSSDEFRIYSFKVRPCSRAYSHDWTECPFVHPGENARRRDPRKFIYSCVPCPDFRKGACTRGDSCEYAHGVFESWLHPAQYRTKICKDGTSCNRRVCFFAHTNDELRTVYQPGGGGGGTFEASPRSARALEMAMMNLLPGSPSAVGLSPSANGMNSPTMGWPQPSVPMLHLPNSNFQSSRLRSSFNARDIPVDEFSTMLDLDGNCFSPGHARNSPFSGNGMRPVRSNTVPAANLDSLFSAEVSSPRYNAAADQGSIYSPSHKAALLNQLHHHQQQAMLSPINTRMYSPRAVDNQQQRPSMFMSSPGCGSPRSMEQLAISAQREKLRQEQQRLRSLLSCELSPGMGSPTNGLSGDPSLSKWGSSNGKLDWGVNTGELDRVKKPSTDTGRGGEDFPWIPSVLGDTGEDIVMNSTTSAPSAGNVYANPNTLMEDHAVLDSWLEQLQLDQALA